ncbi:MAG TPA: hypothetical protein VNQ90_17780 [Chthoniobacteraceae bacterium]|nr:hypothetical protein [Chthoniobacteraceae bacterium]
MTATTDTQTEEKLRELTSQLADARAEEAAAKAKRIQAEEAIVALLDPGERSTVTVDPGNGLKVTIKTDLSYKADIDAIEVIDSDLVKVTTKKELDTKAYEALREQNTALFDHISEYVTVTPKKPAVTLKVV